MVISIKELRQMLKHYGYVKEAKLPEHKLIAWWNSDDSDVAHDIINGG